MVRKPFIKVHAYMLARGGKGYISLCRKIRADDPKLGDLVTCRDCKKALDKLDV